MALHPLPSSPVPGASSSRTKSNAPVSFRSLFRSLRPRQWTKNLVVFAAVLFGKQLYSPRAVALSVAAFVIFCALSGVVYLINDVMDRENDRQHPTKALRPIASGELSVAAALGAAALIGVTALAASWMFGRGFGMVATSYVLLLGFYSGPLKHIVILDVLTIAMGFVLRAVGGAVIIDVPISHWLLVCTILLALFLTLSKRRQELTMLAESATSHRRILSEYSPYLLDQMIAVVTASTLMGYALYTVSPSTIEKFGTDRLLWTFPFPLYGILRYLYLVHQKQGGGSPADMLLTDRPLLVCVALWAVSVVLIVYRPFGL